MPIGLLNHKELAMVKFDGDNFIIAADNMPQWVGTSGFYMGHAKAERKFADVLVDEIKHGDNFLDAGANFGSYAFLASRRSSGKIIAIEPHFWNYCLAKYNLTHYRHADTLMLALGDKIGLVNLHINKQNHGGHTLLNAHEYANVIGANDSTHKSQFTHAQPVMMVTVDSLGIPFDIMKIDVEGYEMPVLKGAMNTLKHTRLLLIETHFQGEQTELIEFLSHDYTLENVNPHGIIARRK